MQNVAFHWGLISEVANSDFWVYCLPTKGVVPPAPLVSGIVVLVEMASFVSLLFYFNVNPKMEGVMRKDVIMRGNRGMAASRHVVYQRMDYEQTNEESDSVFEVHYPIDRYVVDVPQRIWGDKIGNCGVVY